MGQGWAFLTRAWVWESTGWSAGHSGTERTVARALICFLALVIALIAVSPSARADGRAASSLLSKSDHEIYIEAFAAAQDGNWKAAHEIAARARNPLGAKILRWWDFGLLESPTTFEDVRRFAEANPDWPLPHRIESAVEAMMRRHVSDEAVLAYFRWRDPMSRHGRLRYAKALLAEGKTEQAAKFVRIAWVHDRFSTSELKATHRRFGSLLRPEDHVARLDRLVWESRAKEAKRMFPYVDAGYQRLAEARLRLRAMGGGVDGAIAQVPRELRDDPGLLYERTRWRRRKGRDESAREILGSPPEELGRPKFWWRERSIQIRRTLADGNISEAYTLAANHGQIASLTFSEAEWLAGWIALRFLDEPHDAYRHFARVHSVVHMPISRARAAYWSARAAEAAGDREGAILWYGAGATYPGTFYGQLSAARLGAPDAPLMRQAEPPRPASKPKLLNHELVAATRLLAALEVEDLVKAFVLHLSDLAKSESDHAIVAELALSLDRPNYAIHAAKRGTRDGYVSNKRLFPLVDVPFARPDEELEHALVLAITRQESLFDTAARSRAGARGLMQLMPATAKLVARKLEVKYQRRELTADPAYNVSLGSAYLYEMIETYDGSYLLAIAAYNAGPGNVQRWLRANGDPRRDPSVDIVDWIEMIPIAETRNYVQRVLEGLQVYRWRRGGTPTVTSLEHDLLRGLSPASRTARCAPGEETLAPMPVALRSAC